MQKNKVFLFDYVNGNPSRILPADGDKSVASDAPSLGYVPLSFIQFKGTGRDESEDVTQFDRFLARVFPGVSSGTRL
ncbi:hypothetical protein OUZ56_013125 [Daphnia magna]|uniref:Uncharacterized protein n=1 Tax=Daphnia magna TaxID=35525 RepID=A0ABQ9Z4Z5_9CRUS|nr:hypothetical protein OUZ56_013125 [Daphnia magna]